MSFTTTELILLILIVSIILIIFVVLTISEIKDYLNSKKRLLLTGDDEKHETVKVEKPIVKKTTVIKREPITIVNKVDSIKEESKKENIIIEEEEVVLPKPKKSEIIIEEDEEYYDPFFDEEDVVLEKPQVNEIKDELHYTDVLDIPEAKEEIEKVTEKLELKKDEVKEKINNYEDTITNFEMEQEENAIISLDELSKISDKMYEENEPIQYDDSDVPITIDEIMNRFNKVDEIEETPVVVTTKNAIKEDSDEYFIEEEDEEDFLRDLSRAHRRMNSR